MLPGCWILSFALTLSRRFPARRTVTSTNVFGRTATAPIPLTFRLATPELAVSTVPGHVADVFAVTTPAVTRFAKPSAPTFTLLTLDEVVLELPTPDVETVLSPSVRTPPGRAYKPALV